MKEAPPNLVLQEPTATGWQRTEIYGDKDVGRKHIHDARKVLGALRSRTGVNERIAQGQAGGFYHQWSMLADGTRIHAITNDGHDTVRIYPPGGQPLPPPPPPKREPSGMPYMWVGLRVRYDQCRTDRYAPVCTMVEPNGGELRGIVNDHWALWCGFAPFRDEGGHMTRIGNVTGSAIVMPPDWTVQDLLQDHHSMFMGEGSQPFTIQARKQLRDHNFWLADDSSDGGGFFCSANGLRLYSRTIASENGMPSEKWGAYDPLMDEAQNNGEGRDSSGLILDPSEEGLRDEALRGWDAVYVLDPHEAEGYAPCDARPHILAASDMLREAGFVQGESQILPGKYMLTVNAVGEIIPESDRYGEPITTIEHDPPLFRSQYCDYLEHIVPQDYTLPMVVEVEVRLGKMARDDHPDTRGMSVFNFELTCADYHNYENVSYPFGYGDDADWDPCFGYPGSNPAGPNYSDFIAIDVWGRSAELVSKADVDLVPVFGGGQYKALDGQFKFDLDLYIFGDVGVSQVDPDEYATKAGEAIFKALEVFTSGAYVGCVNLTYRSVADLITACRDISNDKVWLYNVISNTITALPVVESTEAMRAAHDYDAWMDWYYPYRKASRAACRAPAAILLQAGPEFVYDWGSGYGPDDTEDHNCCG